MPRPTEMVPDLKYFCSFFHNSLINAQAHLSDSLFITGSELTEERVGRQDTKNKTLI